MRRFFPVGEVPRDTPLTARYLPSAATYCGSFSLNAGCGERCRLPLPHRPVSCVSGDAASESG